jgi:hypothetical protein
MGTALKGIGILVLFIAILGILIACIWGGISWLHSSIKKNAEKQTELWNNLKREKQNSEREKIELRNKLEREKQNLAAGAPNPPILYCKYCGNKLNTNVITDTTYDENTGKPIYSFTAERICPKCLINLWPLKFYSGTWNEPLSGGSDAPNINIHIT